MKKVVLISHADILGGASLTTYRLMYALRRAGVDARMIVFTKLTDDENVSLVSSRYMRSLSFLMERGEIFVRNGFNRKDLFKVSTASTGIGLTRHPWVREADVIHLHWINQGFVSLRGLRQLVRLGKPMVWTMHDMWCFTGVCHHSLGCKKYTDVCGACPLLGSDRPVDLSTKTQRRKGRIYDNSDIHFVGVSNWIAERARESRLLCNADIKVIPNAFPIETYYTESKHEPTAFGLDYSRRLIVMAASTLDDHIKGLPLGIKALNKFAAQYPELTAESQLLLFGRLKNPHALKDLRFPFRFMGRIDDQNLMRRIYAASDVVISPSLFETLPGTLIEGQAAGCVPVSFDRGGQADIIDHMKTGYIAFYPDTDDFARGIHWALTQAPDRNMLHEEVRRKFASEAVAARYIELYDSI